MNFRVSTQKARMEIPAGLYTIEEHFTGVKGMDLDCGDV